MASLSVDSALLPAAKYGNIGIAVAVVGVLVAIIVPLPPFALDILLTFNLSISLLILLTTVYAERSLDLSVFPSLLLFTTLFRLSLNVATTRRILLTAEAGQVIEAFGSFVVGGNYVVGAVVFCILIVIQFVVITKGAGRIAEVAARFTLDAMPGKQMAIDADLNTGLITEEEAKERRRLIAREADFYGAMDGASKFIRGDAIAGVIITMVNVFGGLAIGVFQMGMSAGEAARRFTLLTIGDGLVAQIPSLIIATAAGLLISRAGGSERSVGEDLMGQLLRRPNAVMISSAVLLFFGLMPGLPTVPFLLLSVLTAVVGYVTAQTMRRAKEQATAALEKPPGVPEGDRVKQLLHVDPMELEIGYGLIGLVDRDQGGDLLDRITAMRRQVATEMGFVVPPIRIRDNLQLRPNEYALKINGTAVGRSELMLNMFLALNTGAAREKVQGIDTVEPSFGMPAVWITQAQKERAEALGHTVVQASSVLATHLSETIRNHAAELLGRQGVQTLLDTLKKEYPVLVDELVPSVLTVGQVQRVLQNLLAEKVSIRNLPTILEALSDYRTVTKDTDVLTEHARRALARTITKQYANAEGAIAVILIDPKLEADLNQALQKTTQGSALVLDPSVARALFERLSKKIEELGAVMAPPILLCAPTLRLPLRRVLQRNFPSLVVLSYSDLTPEAEIRSVGLLSFEERTAATVAVGR